MIQQEKIRIFTVCRRKGANSSMPHSHERINWRPKAAPEFELTINSFTLFVLLQGLLVGGILALSLTGNAIMYGMPRTHVTSTGVKEHPALKKEANSRTTQSRMRLPQEIEVSRGGIPNYLVCSH